MLVTYLDRIFVALVRSLFLIRNLLLVLPSLSAVSPPWYRQSPYLMWKMIPGTHYWPNEWLFSENNFREDDRSRIL